MTPRAAAALRVMQPLAWRYWSQTLLNTAVKQGAMARPAACATCGATGPVEAHHVSYARPFDVEWLCHRCHMRVHHCGGVVRLIKWDDGGMNRSDVTEQLMFGFQRAVRAATDSRWAA